RRAPPRAAARPGRPGAEDPRPHRRHRRAAAGGAGALRPAVVLGGPAPARPPRAHDPEGLALRAGGRPLAAPGPRGLASGASRGEGRGVARRKLSLSLSSVVRAVGAPPAAGDDVAQVVLDAAADLMRRHGLGRWSVDDVADAAGVGRTSVYRWFGSRDELVHAVLARELRETLEEIAREAASASSFEERTVEAVLVCLRRLEGSVVDHLLQVDPQAVLPLLTTGAAPLLDLARSALAPQLV